MIIEIKVPTPGESITQVVLSRKLVDNNAIVEQESEIAEVDSDKATLTIIAEQAGKIAFLAEEGETLAVGSTIATIDTAFDPKPASDHTLKTTSSTAGDPAEDKGSDSTDMNLKIVATPLAQRMMETEALSIKEVDSYMRTRKITKEIIESYLRKDEIITEDNTERLRTLERTKLSPLRQKLAQRLVSVKNETAMLTTFNEIDMTSVKGLKNKYGISFKETHGVSLGYMSLFTKAASIALQHFPMVNSQIDGDEIVSFDYNDISIAVNTPKGLLVPVVRNVELMSVPEIEISIKELATKARESKLSLDEMNGGTFTITNGGVFGSLMSTPIINPPQSAILGMHNIVDRPIALNGEVVIRPMMYVALSYDHRIIDGRDSVGFLKTIKELIENPLLLLSKGKDPYTTLFKIDR